MRVGVNARRLVGQRLGVGRYIEYLLQHWAACVDAGDSVELFVPEPVGGGGLPDCDRIRSRVLRPRLHGVVWENLVLAPRAHDVDVLFCPSYTAPRTWRGRLVVAIHSANEITPGSHDWRYRFTYSAIYRMSARRADRVIVPSRVVGDDMQALYDIPPERVVVVPLGADAMFRPVDDEARRIATRQRLFGDDRPFVIWVGKLSQRRNIPVLVEAFARAKRREGLPHRLLLFGPNHLGLPIAEHARRLGIADSVVQTDGVLAAHGDLVDIYNSADLYVNPSLYDGFSLPLVEALACGTPVVATDRGALAEIAGDAALVISEPTAEAFADGITRALTDDALRDDLRARGPKRAERFRWRETAARTWDVLADVARS